MNTAEAVCIQCGLVIKEGIHTLPFTVIPIHEKCREDWDKLTPLQKRIKTKVYELGQDDTWSPSYYQGLSDAEASILEIVEECPKCKTKMKPQYMDTDTEIFTCPNCKTEKRIIYGDKNAS